MLRVFTTCKSSSEKDSNTYCYVLTGTSLQKREREKIAEKKILSAVLESLMMVDGCFEKKVPIVYRETIVQGLAILSCKDSTFP